MLIGLSSRTVSKFEPYTMASCVVCQKSLILHVEDEENDEDMSDPTEDLPIDDDVLLPCKCHFHWQCLLDSSFEVTNCPNCNTHVVNVDSNGTQQLLCDLNNEGGLQKGQDILPILNEESYLRAYPEERKARAFLQFCADGDIEAIVDVLRIEDNLDTDERNISTASFTSADDILRYQDQLGSMSSALHLAIQNQRVEVAWLLLLLASHVEDSAFPIEAMSMAQDVGISRSDYRGSVDIRSLKDSEGMTAYERARDIGGVWETWVSKGVFMNEPLLKAP